MVRIKSSQKIFTEDEVANLTGICLEHLARLGSQQASWNPRKSR